MLQFCLRSKTHQKINTWSCPLVHERHNLLSQFISASLLDKFFFFFLWYGIIMWKMLWFILFDTCVIQNGIFDNLWSKFYCILIEFMDDKYHNFWPFVNINVMSFLSRVRELFLPQFTFLCMTHLCLFVRVFNIYVVIMSY